MIANGTKVIAPLGQATIAAQGEHGQVLVLYSRKDYSREVWLVISRGNGPCVFRMYDEGELTPIQESEK